MSETPRTDAVWAEITHNLFRNGTHLSLLEFARQLEREVNALHAQIKLMDGGGKHYAAPDAGALREGKFPSAAPVAAPTPRTDAYVASVLEGVDKADQDFMRQLERELTALQLRMDKALGRYMGEGGSDV